MNVFQVKNAIIKTECADYVYSGLFCSEPIMSKDVKGKIVDNYIVFSRSGDCKFISAPECVFGIYTVVEESAYVNDSISKEFSEHIYEEKFADELKDIATSLKIEYKKEFSREDIIINIINSLNKL